MTQTQLDFTPSPLCMETTTPLTDSTIDKLMGYTRGEDLPLTPLEAKHAIDMISNTLSGCRMVDELLNAVLYDCTIAGDTLELFDIDQLVTMANAYMYRNRRLCSK